MKCKYVLGIAIFLLFVCGSFFYSNSEAGEQSTTSKIEAPYEHLLNILATNESTKFLSKSQIIEVSEADLSDTDMHYIAIMSEAVKKHNHCKQGCRIEKISCAYIDGRKSLYVQASLTQSSEAAKNPLTGGLLDLGILHYRSCSLIFKSDFIYCATSNGTGLSLTDVDKMRRENKNFAEAAKILPNYTTKYSLKDY
jgi:hypothetical protein